MTSMTRERPIGLYLGGGGARAAYQVGVLRWISQRYPGFEFPLLTGVSAGAINATFLGNHQGSLARASADLVEIWAKLRTQDVIESQPQLLAANVLRWGVRLVSGSAELSPVQGMVRTGPLRRLLQRVLNTTDDTNNELLGIDANLKSGRLEAVAVTTTDYYSGKAVTWVQGNSFSPWERQFRDGRAARLTVDHVMASASVPLFFPAIKLGRHWHGDGGVRQTAPLSPALHLGARRILVISTRKSIPQHDAETATEHPYPPPAQILGMLLNTLFFDLLDYDSLTAQRINALLEHLPVGHSSPLHKIDLLVLRPSQDLGMLAKQHELELPRALRFLTRGWGTTQTRTADSLAMLLFESGYTQRLMEIGMQDAAAQAEQLDLFLMGEKPTISKTP